MIFTSQSDFIHVVVETLPRVFATSLCLCVFIGSVLLCPQLCAFDSRASNMAASRKELVLAYRHLYQHCLRAVQYSKPARYTARDRLRQAFRANPPSSFDAARIRTTLEFLDGAARARGLEHKVVKNLLHVWAIRSNQISLYAHIYTQRQHD